MRILLESGDYTFSPELTQGHKMIAIGTGAAVPYIPQGAKVMLVQATVKPVRYTLDGSAPSATVGFQLTEGYDPTVIVLGKNITPRFFGTDATSVLQYCFGI